VIRLIAAIDAKRGMADAEGIPWQGNLPSDARYFRDRTAEGIIVMGFRTYEEFDRPLHDRANYVVGRPRSPELRPGFHAVEQLDEFLSDHGDEIVWIIGGAGLYQQTVSVADELYLTQLEGDFQCTKFFPRYDDHFTREWSSEPHEESGISFRFEIWRRSTEFDATTA
jgi:dihydrofolate reductase